MKKAFVSFWLKLAAAGLALAATMAAHAAPEEITYLLPAPPSLPAFAPWFVAQKMGYYADENLKVNFVTAKGGVDVAKQVGAGNAVIGGAIGDTTIIVRPNGIPVKTVAVIGGGALTRIAVRKSGPIKTIADLKGKTITVMSYSDSNYYALLGTLRIAGLSKKDLSIQAAGPSGIWQLFAAGKSDAMTATPDWFFDAYDATHGDVRYLPVANTFPSMAQSIVASDETIKNNPQLIKRLVRATLRGMEYTMKNPKGAAAIYAQALPQFKGREAWLERVLKAFDTQIYSGQKTLGEMDEKRLAIVQNFYVSEGIVPKATPLSDLYTNQFIGTDR